MSESLPPQGVSKCPYHPVASSEKPHAKRELIPNVEQRGQRMLDQLPELHKPLPGAIFDQPEAAAYSCYAGIRPPHNHDSIHAPHLLRVIPKNRLWPEDDDEPVPPLGESAHDQLRAFILSEYFPCIGAKAAFKRGTYRFGFYKELAHLGSVAAMGRDLRRFILEYKNLGQFTSFIAAFKHPQISDEDQFEQLLWQHLQILHDNDIDEWDPNYSSDPNDPKFAFSFYGEAFFIVGMHPGSSRFSRRIGFPFLIFNPESQIRRLKDEGLLERFAGEVRQRDIFFQGDINPSLPIAMGTSGGEARVYSGKKHLPAENWQCPFKPRNVLPAERCPDNE